MRREVDEYAVVVLHQAGSSWHDISLARDSDLQASRFRPFSVYSGLEGMSNTRDFGLSDWQRVPSSDLPSAQ